MVGVLPAQVVPVDTTEQLRVRGERILAAPSFAERDSMNEWFLHTLEAYLRTPGNWQDPLSEVRNMIRLSDEETFAIYTWQMPDSTRRYQRFGLVAVPTEQGVKTHRLIDNLGSLREPMFTVYRPHEWPGAVYYKLLPDGQEEGRFTLLGYAPNPPVHKKIIEVLEIGPRGRVRFGAKQFKVDQWADATLRKPPMRLILQYNAKYSATVNWHEGEEAVIMDHLAPPTPKMKRVYASYGPDFTYDKLYWDDGWWHLKEQVRFDTGQERTIVPPKKPVDLPQSGQSAPRDN